MESACTIQEIFACVHSRNPHIESGHAVYPFQQKKKVGNNLYNEVRYLIK